MVSADLKEFIDRTNNAADEIDQLEQQLAVYSSSEIYVEKTDSGAGTFDVFLVKKSEIPIKSRVLVGTIANELRACLDGLACALAVRNGKVSSGTYFPISKDKAIFEGDGLWKLRKLSNDDKAKIASLRPYGGGNDLLFGFHDLDRLRKHTRLAVFGLCNTHSTIGMFAVSNGGRIQIDNGIIAGPPGFGGGFFKDFELGTAEKLTGESGRIRIAKNLPQTAQIKSETGINFDEPPGLAGKPVVPTLRQFSTEVKRIIQMF